MGAVLLFTDLTLHNQLQKSLSIQGYSKLTEVQEKAITKALLGHDLMVASKTGSGKTLAFAVPIVHRLLTQRPLSRQDARAIILAPTRELARQVFTIFAKLTQATRLQTALIVGGENFNDQAKKLKHGADIIVATAGRLADHLESKHLFLNGLEVLVLDEADRMLELGFQQQLVLINQQADHRKRQTMWFSATLDSIEVERLSRQMLRAPTRLEIDKIEQPHTDIEQHFFLSDGPAHKDQQLLKLIVTEERKQTLVFVATKRDTERLSFWLQEHALDSGYLHGDMLQNKRNQVIQDFINNKIGVLVTTDIASRGLDIRNIFRVINYDLPKHADEYVHRIGRTGRAGDQGYAYSLVGKKDWWSFVNINARLNAEYKFEIIQGLKAKFSGHSSTKNSTNKKNSPPIRKQSTKSKSQPQTASTAKRNDEQHAMQDVGYAPMKRRKNQ